MPAGNKISYKHKMNMTQYECGWGAVPAVSVESRACSDPGVHPPIQRPSSSTTNRPHLSLSSCPVNARLLLVLLMLQSRMSQGASVWSYPAYPAKSYQWSMYRCG